MAIRNYVGARYVPKFANPVEWQANTSYEAMVIVTYNNSSYTSKVPVSPTVGNPAENPTYWALTGNYNAQVEEYRQETSAQVEEYRQETSAQVEEYRQETSAVKNELNIVKNDLNNTNKNLNKTLTIIRKPLILCVGDSYGRGHYNGVENIDESWPAYLGNSPYCDTVNYCISGACAERGATNVYYTQEIINAKTDGIEPDIIVLSAGTNDYQCSNLYDALVSFIDSCNTTFPNARLYIDWNSVAYTLPDGSKRDFDTQYFNCYNIYRDVCAFKGIPFSTSCINARFSNYSIANDMMHLTPAGYKSIANDLKNVIFGGGIQYNYGNCERLKTVDNIDLFFTQCGDNVKVNCDINASNDISSALNGIANNDSVSDSEPASSYGPIPNLIEGFSNKNVDTAKGYYALCNAQFNSVLCVETGSTIKYYPCCNVSIWVHDGKIRLGIASVGQDGFNRIPSGSKASLHWGSCEIIVPAIYFC